MEHRAFAYHLKEKSKSKNLCNQLQMLTHFKVEILYYI